ncbi:MAG: type II-A CRISPR-associated protein Csn2 [Bacillus sp. (in: Bacteria)]|nr:type II-A CRISPR-associated protein Csn2 [Bacillus sp. (in: firmicutes)]
MKLAHPELERQILFDNCQSCEWVIESPVLFAKYVEELYFQAEGKEGGFVLSEDDKEIDIEKSLEVIINPFAVSVNDKKILNKLYAKLSEVSAMEEMYLLTQKIQSELQTYMLQLEYICPYMLAMDTEVDMTNIMKAMGVRIENYADDYFENLILYIKMIAELLQKKIVVLVNIGSYIEQEQIEQLFMAALHSEIKLLLIENKQRSFSNEVVRYIIDKDGCEI